MNTATLVVETEISFATEDKVAENFALIQTLTGQISKECLEERRLVLQDLSQFQNRPQHVSWLRVSAFVALQGHEKDPGFSAQLLVAEEAKLGTIEPTTRKVFVDAQVLAAGHA